MALHAPLAVAAIAPATQCPRVLPWGPSCGVLAGALLLPSGKTFSACAPSAVVAAAASAVFATGVAADDASDAAAFELVTVRRALTISFSVSEAMLIRFQSYGKPASMQSAKGA